MSFLWSRVTLVAAVALAAAPLAGCSAIFNPENSDDVLRCGNALECEAHDVIANAVADNRRQAQCKSPASDGSGDISQSNEDQVCSVTDAEIGCDPESQNLMHPYRVIYDAAANSNGIYTTCAEERRGSVGCKPTLQGMCDAGLATNAFGVCDIPESDTPAVEPSSDLAGFDVRDQYCRSFFCDEAFVCDGSGPKPICRRCDPDAPIGEGGCAVLYVAGAPSTIYADPNEGCEDVAKTDEVDFGPLPPQQNPTP
ncbi:MAG: hypothetical protein R3A79_24295 [Nannocystaceae bacterium]